MRRAMAPDTLAALLASRLEGSIAVVGSLRRMLADIAAVAGAVTHCLTSGGLVTTAGNGGSAAQALHLAEELIGRYRSDRPPKRALCLCADPTALTCIANDFGFEHVFARQCEALLGPGDALVALTTSGRSPNVVEALRAARQRGAATIGLLGGDGGACAALCDHAVIVPGSDSAFIQEAHQVIIHLICEAVEQL